MGLKSILGALANPGSLLSGVKDIIGSLKLPPEVKAQLEDAVDSRAHEFAKLELDSAIRTIETVNETMRAEAKSDHWLQWSWRPIVGYTFSAMLLNNYVALPYFKNRGLLPIELPEYVFLAMLSILGVAAWTRGKEKIERAKNGKNS